MEGWMDGWRVSGVACVPQKLHKREQFDQMVRERELARKAALQKYVLSCSQCSHASWPPYKHPLAKQKPHHTPLKTTQKTPHAHTNDHTTTTTNNTTTTNTQQPHTLKQPHTLYWPHSTMAATASSPALVATNMHNKMLPHWTSS